MFEWYWQGGCLILALLCFLGAGIWVGFSLIGVGFLGLMMAEVGQLPLVFASSSFDVMTRWSLVPLPLFIWMGEILFRTRLADDLFRGLSPLLHRLPGGLLHVNVFSCGIFAAVSGSSAATTATIGKMTLPALRQRGYTDSLAIGTLAGAGTLGLLIPPSIILIVYGVAAEVSILKLFMAGVIPGLMLMFLFSLFVMLKGGRAHKADKPALSDIRYLLPIGCLISVVLGSLYSGLATPTEAAALGVTGALVLAKLSGALSLAVFKASLLGACKTSCMIGFILMAAGFLTLSLGYLQLPVLLTQSVAQLALEPYALILGLTLVFVILGLFLDGISVVLLTSAVVLPVVSTAGIDLLWFGIYLVLVVEMSQITPPVGFNLFVIQGMTNKGLLEVATAAFPFFVLILCAIVFISLFPELVLWLPETLTSR